MPEPVDHGARDHATWSASATARNVHCPGALALAAGAPRQPESLAAARGTACHQLAEACLRSGASVASHLGTVQRTKERAIEVDDELVASAEVYVDYVRARTGDAARQGGALLIEQRFTLADLHPPFEAGGTADAVLHFPTDRLLEVVDLKNGMGIVDARDNPQLRTYGLGALLARPGLDVERVRVTIVQPRAPFHGEVIRSDDFHVADLIEWTAGLLDAMATSRRAADELGAAGGIPDAAWSERWLRPGKCKFCAREATCPALDREGGRAAEAAARWFDAPTVRVVEAGEAEQLSDLLERFDLVEDWIKAKRARAHQLAEAGVEIPGYRLVETSGHRRWQGGEGVVVAALVELGLADDDIHDRKLKSPAAVEKLLPKDRRGDMADLWVKPVTGKTLVRSTSTTRPTVQGTADRYFQSTEN